VKAILRSAVSSDRAANSNVLRRNFSLSSQFLSQSTQLQKGLPSLQRLNSINAKYSVSSGLYASLALFNSFLKSVFICWVKGACIKGQLNRFQEILCVGSSGYQSPQDEPEHRVHNSYRTSMFQGDGEVFQIVTSWIELRALTSLHSVAVVSSKFVKARSYKQLKSRNLFAQKDNNPESLATTYRNQTA
jgi:hypothetical protein